VGGGSYLTAQEGDLWFGLAGEEGAVDLEIVWPDGKTDRHAGVAIDRLVTIRPGEPPE